MADAVHAYPVPVPVPVPVARPVPVPVPAPVVVEVPASEPMAAPIVFDSGSRTPWCYTGPPYQFLVFDGRIVFCLLLVLWDLTSIGLWCFALVTMFVAGLMKFIRWPLPMLLRRVRAWLAGPIRPRRPPPRLFL